MDFSTASAQLKSIKHKFSCSNLADFKYTSLGFTKSQLHGIFIKHINM